MDTQILEDTVGDSDQPEMKVLLEIEVSKVQMVQLDYKAQEVKKDHVDKKDQMDLMEKRANKA